MSSSACLDKIVAMIDANEDGEEVASEAARVRSALFGSQPYLLLRGLTFAVSRLLRNVTTHDHTPQMPDVLKPASQCSKSNGLIKALPWCGPRGRITRIRGVCAT